MRRVFKILTIFNLEKLVPQYIHPYQSTLMSDIKLFGGVDGYFQVMKDHGFWDYEKNQISYPYYD